MFAPATQPNPQSYYAAPNNHAGKAPHGDKPQQGSGEPRGNIDHIARGKPSEGADQAEKPTIAAVRDAKPSVVYIHRERYERVDTYSATGSRGLAPVEAAGPSEHAEVAAGNILQFIEAQMRTDLAASATPKELASRLEAGLDGFLQGFEEARSQLNDLGLLSSEMDAEIQGTYDLVLAGIADLENEFLDGASITKPEPRLVAPVAVETNAVSRSEAVQSSRFSFELTTADGDTVVIQARSVNAMISESMSQSSQEGAGSYSLTQAFSQNSEFELVVEGHLDDRELAAISDLLGQVSELSESFFSGDLDGAFNEALNLGYDSSEIVQFSLNLSQSSVQRVTQAYQQFIPSTVSELDSAENAPAALSERLKPLGSFVQGLLDTLETASYFSSPDDLIDQLAEFFDRPERPRFQVALSQLLEGLERT